jgi:Fe-S cluster biosynthesis and repair protein YggX
MTQSSTSGAGSQPSRQVLCVKLGRELPGLPARPFPNELGQRLYDRVSMEAWGLWLQQSKMLVNEYRLNLSLPEAREFLMAQCDRFFFGEGGTPPPDYVPKG